MKARMPLLLALLTSLALVLTTGCGHRTTKPTVPVKTNTFDSLQKDLQKSYLELFRISPSLEYTDAQISEMRDYLNNAQDYCVGEFNKKVDNYDSQLQKDRDELKAQAATISESRRHELHCQIQNAEILKSQAKVLADNGIPTAYQNKLAKLDLIQKWPGDLKQIKQEIATGSYKNLQWENVQDIGLRTIAAGQKDDIKTGEEARKQLQQSGLMPPKIEDPAIVDYVDSVGHRVGDHSDLKVPLHITVLDSKEINAFALPGGFVYVERGLLEAADDEAELAGVLGHEIAHVVARHGHKLMQKEEIASIFMQAAEIAAVVLTGGVGGIGTYYAMQYGFYGLGMVLNLELLGVSREYELQADKLGIEYAWNAGYDPSGFIRFFDKMATKEGYVNGIAWFHDHPPFYERMVDAERQIMFLPKKNDLIENTPAFGKMKDALKTYIAEHKKENQPVSAKIAQEQGCPAPTKYEYKPGQPIETLCNLPGAPSGPTEQK